MSDDIPFIEIVLTDMLYGMGKTMHRSHRSYGEKYEVIMEMSKEIRQERKV